MIDSPWNSRQFRRRKDYGQRRINGGENSIESPGRSLSLSLARCARMCPCACMCMSLCVCPYLSIHAFPCPFLSMHTRAVYAYAYALDASISRKTLTRTLTRSYEIRIRIRGRLRNSMRNECRFLTYFFNFNFFVAILDIVVYFDYLLSFILALFSSSSGTGN